MAKKARKYSKGASKKVGRAMKKRKAGTLRSGRSGRKVKSRKPPIAIGLSEARRASQQRGFHSQGRRSNRGSSR